MSNLEKISCALLKFFQSAASILKVIILSRSVDTAKKPDDGSEIIIMGNGPSLRQTINSHLSLLQQKETMAVNFAANAPEFFSLRPSRYILADPHFFDGIKTDPNVARLWENLSKINWSMTLHIPASQKENIRSFKFADSIKIKYFNLTPIEGYKAISHLLMRKGLGMPRPRNVLIAAIMVAINSGYQKIWIVGADHTWSQTLSVDDQNRVLSVQPHFYADNAKELDRVAQEYAGYHLHDILGSLTIAFKSYFEIKDYAISRGVSIFNATPGSFIDAFPRKKL